MPANPTKSATNAYFIEELKRMRRELRALKTNQNSVFVFPKVTADPSSPVDGQAWNNTTSNTFKIRINGVTKTVTVT